MSDLLFGVLATLLVAFALATVLARSLFRAAYALAGALLATAFLYMMLAAPILAAVQILLYTGGVLTLIVFALVMTHRPEPERPWRRPWPAAAAAALTFAVLASFAVRVGDVPSSPPMPGGAAVGRAVFTTYVVPFELLSVLLLGALFGALVIARRDEPR